jgi:predicted ester cyclase
VDHEELRGIPPTREGLKQKYTLLRAGFPDFGFTIEDLFSAGDRVAELRGTVDRLGMLTQLGIRPDRWPAPRPCPRWRRPGR